GGHAGAEPGAAVGGAGQAAAVEGRVGDDHGGDAGLAGAGERGGHRLPGGRVGLVGPVQVVDDLVGAGAVQGEADDAVPAGGGAGAEGDEADRGGGREAGGDGAGGAEAAG